MRYCFSLTTRLSTKTLFFVMLVGILLPASCSAQYRTANFVVYAQQPAFAKKVGDEAERFRKELSMLWLGRELPQWQQPCPIKVEIAAHAGGETSFAFSPGRDGTSMPFDWRMKIFGSPERILDSVLPHEVTHTIFATHFGRPLPRWADEGACTTVEDISERKKNHRMLIDFLTSNRGIPFNHMFAMKQYPSDILPLYAQGYSLARYFIQQKGHRHFVNFIGEGMQREVPGREPATWNAVVKKYYGYEHLSDLQLSWQAWVKKGCPDIRPSDPNTAIAANVGNSSPLPVRNASTPMARVSTEPASTTTAVNSLDQGSWYARQSRTGGKATMRRPAKANSPNHSDKEKGYRPGSIDTPNKRSTEKVSTPPDVPTHLSSQSKTIWR